MIGKNFDFFLMCFIALACLSVFASHKIFKLKSVTISKDYNNANYKEIFYIMAIFFLTLFYATYITMIPLWEEFTYQDSNIFWTTLKNGKQHYGNPIWYDSGRFFPLGHQEFQLISKISASNYAYHLFAVFELIAIFFLSLKLFGKKVGIIFFILLTITEAFVQSFFGLIYPERNMAVLLILSMLLLNIGIERKNTIKLVASIFFFSFFLFYKETAFLITAGFSFSLLFSYFLDNKNKFKLASSLSLAFISLLWLASYGIDIYPTINKAYGNQNRDITQAFINLINSPWIYTAIASLLIFLYKQRKSPYALLPIVTIGYSFVMYYMNFSMPYYHLPSVLISIYCLFVNALNFDARIKWLIIALLSIYIIITSIGSVSIIKERKESVFAKSDALDFIYKDNYLSKNKKLDVAFHYIDPWTVHILSGSFTNKYKVEMKGRLGGDCNNADYAIYFTKKPNGKDFYTTQSVPMWKSNYKLFVVKCN